jgi:hypothetical protein
MIANDIIKNKSQTRGVGISAGSAQPPSCQKQATSPTTDMQHTIQESDLFHCCIDSSQPVSWAR